MHLSDVKKFNCGRIAPWSIISDGKKAFFLYMRPGVIKELLYASLTDANVDCNSTLIDKTHNSFFFPQGNIFNSTNIGVFYAKGGNGINQLIYKNINTYSQDVLTTTVCERDCRGLGISKQSPGSTIIFNHLNDSCTSVKMNIYEESRVQTYTTQNTCALYHWEQAVATADNKIIALWEEASSDSTAVNVTAQIFSGNSNISRPFPVNVYAYRAFEPQISIAHEIAVIAFKGTTIKQGKSILFRAMTLNGIFTTPEINIKNITRVYSPIIQSIDTIVIVGWTHDNSTFSTPSFLMYAQLLYSNGTKIGQELYIGENTHSDTGRSYKITAINNLFLFVFSGSDGDFYTRALDVSQYLIKDDTQKTETKTIHPSMTQTVSMHNQGTLTANSSDTHTNVQKQYSYTLTPQEQRTSHTSSSSKSQSNHHAHTNTDANNPTLTTTRVVEPKARQHTETIVMEPVVTEKPTELKVGAVPKTMVASVQTTGSAASAASVAAGSPGNVVLGSRIETASDIASCNIETLQNNTLSAHSWSVNFGVIIGNYEVEDASNTLYTSLLLWAGVGTIALGVSFLAPTYVSYALGAFVLTDLFLSSTIVSSAVTLMRFGTGTQILAGFGALAVMTIPIIAGGAGVYTHHFGGKYIEGAWQHSQFVAKYGILFKEYTQTYRGWMAVEKAMTVATGTLEGMSTNRECSTVIYWGTAVYSSHFLSTAIFRPYNSIGTKLYSNPNVIFGSISFLQALPFGLASFQAVNPEYKNSTTINTVIEISPTIANAVVAALTIKDIIGCVKTKCWKTKPVSPLKDADITALSNTNTVDSNSDTTILTVPTRDPVDDSLLQVVPTSKNIQSKKTNPLQRGKLTDHYADTQAPLLAAKKDAVGQGWDHHHEVV